MSESAKVSRRKLLVMGAAGATLLVSSQSSAAEDEEEIVAIPLSEYKELKEVGGWTDAELLDGTEIIVARVSQDTFACCNLRCTHGNATVTYQHDHRQFYCPNHHSTFDLNGKPTKGPATKPLRNYPCELAVVVRVPEE